VTDIALLLRLRLRLRCVKIRTNPIEFSIVTALPIALSVSELKNRPNHRERQRRTSDGFVIRAVQRM
jgi:hypothetical protein